MPAGQPDSEDQLIHHFLVPPAPPPVLCYNGAKQYGGDGDCWALWRADHQHAWGHYPDPPSPPPPPPPLPPGSDTTRSWQCQLTASAPHRSAIHPHPSNTRLSSSPAPPSSSSFAIPPSRLRRYVTKHYTVVERVWIRSDTSLPALKIEGARNVVIRDSLIEHPPNGIGIWFKCASPLQPSGSPQSSQMKAQASTLLHRIAPVMRTPPPPLTRARKELPQSHHPEC